MANITQIPAPRVPLIDERTGLMTVQWFRYFNNINTIVGGGTGFVLPSSGGTGTNVIPTNGQILVGNSGGTYTVTNLTATAGLFRTNGDGTLTVGISNTGVTGGAYGSPSSVATYTVNVQGQLVAAANVPIAIAASQITSGILPVVRGGTGADNATGARANLEAAKSGANSDITSLSGLTGGVTNPTFIQFDTTPVGYPTGPSANGTVYWDDADAIKTLNIVMEDSGEVIQHVGEETYYRIKATAPITNGQVVMFTGTVGASGGLLGAPATGLTAFQNEYVMGIATQDIALNGWGYVTWFGEVKKINTTGGAEAWVDGQILYYNPAVAGGLTKFVPTAPNPKVVVATVVHAAVNGILFVRPTFGSALGSTDSNVEITGLANGDLLQYDGVQARWENVPVSTIIANASGAPVTKVADFTVAATDTWIINNKSGSTCTATLPSPATNTGRVLYFQNYQSQFLVSASSNVVPRAGGAATTAILANNAGDTATLVSDGSNWIMTQYTPNNVLLLE